MADNHAKSAPRRGAGAGLTWGDLIDRGVAAIREEGSTRVGRKASIRTSAGKRPRAGSRLMPGFRPQFNSLLVIHAAISPRNPANLNPGNARGLSGETYVYAP